MGDREKGTAWHWSRGICSVGDGGVQLGTGTGRDEGEEGERVGYIVWVVGNAG